MAALPRLRVLVAVAVMCLGVGSLIRSGQSGGRGADEPLPSKSDGSNGVALGMAVSDPSKDDRTISTFSSLSGRKPALIMWFQSWSEPLFYRSQLMAVQRRGAAPVITWSPDSTDYRGPLLRILSGAEDSYIHASAVSARKWGKPIFIRFAHEMNGSWSSWGPGRVGNSPERYVAAWRHVVAIFRKEGAKNVQWVWSPNIYGNVPRFEKYYPGDAWVDWMGLSGYNFAAARGVRWRSFKSLFADSYDALTGLADKPLMVSETASAEGGGDKAEWITEGLTRDLPERLPRVRALVWFNHAKEADWRINSSPESLGAFRAAVDSPAFSRTARELFTP